MAPRLTEAESVCLHVTSVVEAAVGGFIADLATSWRTQQAFEHGLRLIVEFIVGCAASLRRCVIR